MYCSAQGAPGGYAALLEATMIKYDVDLYLTGHLHIYERVHPVQNGLVTVYPESFDGVDLYRASGRGPVQVVQGNAGGMQFEKWQQPQPEWSAVRMANGFIPKNKTSEEVGVSAKGIIDDIKLLKDYHYVDTYGFGVATFVNATHLYYQNVPVEHEKTGPGYDSFWVVKAHA